MKEKRIPLITAISIISVIIFYFLWPSSEKTLTHSAIRDIETQHNTVNLSEDPLTNTPTPPMTNYQECKQLIEHNQNEKLNFGRSQDWNRYLDEGYSIDDITLAIDHFSNSNFAASWRAKQLKKHSELDLKNSNLMELLKNEMPDLPEYFKITTKVPTPALDNISNLTDEAALQLIETTELSIDDVAWLIQQAEVPQKVLFESTKKLDNINQLLGYAGTANEKLLLIDIAAFHGRDKIVTQLIKQNSEISKDPYLGSTMEFALARLNYELGNGIEHDAVTKQINIIKQLQDLNAPAFFDKNTAQLVSGSLPRHYYLFSEEQLNSLLISHQLDFTQIQTKKKLDFDPDAELIVRLRQERDQLLEKNIPRDRLLSCQTSVSNIDKKWQPKTLNHYMTQLKNENLEVNAANLHKIEPVLAACFLVTQERYFSFTYVDNEELKSEVFGKPLSDNKIHEVIKAIESANLTEKQLRWFFYQILPWNAAFYQPLQNSQLRQQQIDWTLLMMFGGHNPSYFEELLINGLDITETDHTGKSLIYHSIEKQKLDLLAYLVSLKGDYHNNPIGKDPLYLLLDTDHYKFSPNTVLSYLDILMQLSPPVHDYHRRELALIRLKYPELYSQISERFGELKITADTPLPLASCPNS